MLRFLIRRLFFLIFIIYGVSILVFVSVRLLPGDPAQVMLGERATPESLANLRIKLGLDKPWFVQYMYYIGNVVQGDLGTSIISNNSVMSDILKKFPATIELAFGSMIIATLVGVSAGILAAVYRNSWIDNIVFVQRV